MRVLAMLMLSAVAAVAGCSGPVENPSIAEYRDKCSSPKRFDNNCQGSVVSWSGVISKVEGNAVIVDSREVGSSDSMPFSIVLSKEDRSEFVVGRSLRVTGVMSREHVEDPAIVKPRIDPQEIEFTSNKLTALKDLFVRRCGENYNPVVRSWRCSDSYAIANRYPARPESRAFDIKACLAEVEYCKDILNQYRSALAVEPMPDKHVSNDVSVDYSGDSVPLPEGNQDRADCSSTAISFIGHRIDGEQDSGDVVRYDNGMGQISYEAILGLKESPVGDPVEVCVQSRPASCPPGDDRGVVYRVTNRRTQGSWVAPNSSHSCGGA